MASFYFHQCGDLPDSDRSYPFSEIYLNNYELAGFEQLKNGERGRPLECTKKSNKIILFKTFRQLEGKYLDYLEASIGKRIVPTGPLVENPTEEDGDHSNQDQFTNWLDTTEPLSTVFVSFRSEYYISKEELAEIAIGLELSKVNFIWVVRFPSGEGKSIHQVLPNGFLERVKSRGLVVEGWAPQTRILGHPSIGGFVSHCGASSVMESLKHGVPIIAMSMHLDQPINARLVGSLGLALEVLRDGEGRYRREEITRVVRKVVVEEDGKDSRRNAQNMRCLMLKKGDEDIDIVAKELVQICEEGNKA